MMSCHIEFVSTLCYSYIYINVLSSVWCDSVISNLITIHMIFWFKLLFGAAGCTTQHNIMKYYFIEFDIKLYE